MVAYDTCICKCRDRHGDPDLTQRPTENVQLGFRIRIRRVARADYGQSDLQATAGALDTPAARTCTNDNGPQTLRDWGPLWGPLVPQKTACRDRQTVK